MISLKTITLFIATFSFYMFAMIQLSASITSEYQLRKPHNNGKEVAINPKGPQEKDYEVDIKISITYLHEPSIWSVYRSQSVKLTINVLENDLSFEIEQGFNEDLILEKNGVKFVRKLTSFNQVNRHNTKIIVYDLPFKRVASKLKNTEDIVLKSINTKDQLKIEKYIVDVAEQMNINHLIKRFSLEDFQCHRERHLHRPIGCKLRVKTSLKSPTLAELEKAIKDNLHAGI